MPTSITPSQALLMLIAHEKNTTNSSLELGKFYRWYMEGFQANEYQVFAAQYLNNSIFVNYAITLNWNDINEEPSRRYFETHLAYETIIQNIDKMSQNSIEEYLDLTKLHLNKALYDYGTADPIDIAIVDFMKIAIEGNAPPEYQDFYLEYSNIIRRLDDGAIFQNMSDVSRQKIKQLIQISALGTVHTIIMSDLPIDIYGKGIFSPNERGVIEKEADNEKNTQSTTRNNSMGLMKGHMPLTSDDAALTQTTSSIIKSSDKSTFDPTAKWVKDSFALKTHPFSNSISGTVLACCRNMAEMKDQALLDNSQVPFTESAQSLAQFHQLFIAVMLYSTGGHSLYEYTSTLSMPEVKHEFRDIENYKSTLSELFLNGNETAFIHALNKTIEYNNKLLTKQEISKSISSLSHKGKLLNALEAMITNQSDKIKNKKLPMNIQSKNKNKMILAKLKEILIVIKEGNYPDAQSEINSLKKALQKQSSGKFFASYRSSKTIKQIETIEKKLEVTVLNLDRNIRPSNR